MFILWKSMKSFYIEQNINWLSCLACGESFSPFVQYILVLFKKKKKTGGLEFRCSCGQKKEPNLFLVTCPIT